MTGYAESNALLALLAEDVDSAHAIVGGLLSNERETLAQAAHYLGLIADGNVCRACAKPVAGGENCVAVGIAEPRQRYHVACYEERPLT